MSNLAKIDFKLAFLMTTLFIEDREIDAAVALVAGHMAFASKEEKKAHLQNMKNILEEAKKQLDATLANVEANLDAEMAGRAG